MPDWVPIDSSWAGWLFTISALTFVGSLVVIPILVSRMRSDYFLSRTPPAESWLGQHTGVWIGVYVLKNLFGIILLLAGIAMLVLPGQGVLTILLGITLLNFPGKRRLELRIVRLPRVLKAINWMRARANRPPLILPEKK